MNRAFTNERSEPVAGSLNTVVRDGLGTEATFVVRRDDTAATLEAFLTGLWRPTKLTVLEDFARFDTGPVMASFVRKTPTLRYLRLAMTFYQDDMMDAISESGVQDLDLSRTGRISPVAFTRVAQMLIKLKVCQDVPLGNSTTLREVYMDVYVSNVPAQRAYEEHFVQEVLACPALMTVRVARLTDVTSIQRLVKKVETLHVERFAADAADVESNVLRIARVLTISETLVNLTIETNNFTVAHVNTFVRAVLANTRLRVVQISNDPRLQGPIDAALEYERHKERVLALETAILAKKTPAGMFVNRDGDNAIGHRVLQLLIAR